MPFLSLFLRLIQIRRNRLVCLKGWLAAHRPWIGARPFQRWLAPILGGVGLFGLGGTMVLGDVQFQRLPAGGLQPQALTDDDHTLHLLWLSGEPKASDIFYQRQLEKQPPSAQVKVNSQPGSAIAVGTIRGAQIALGRQGTVHVIWNGSNGAVPRSAESSPLLYSRWDTTAQTFSPQRNLISRTSDLDGGGTLAADHLGHVYVLWHGGTPGQKTTEEKRQVFLAKSSDDGKTFTTEKPIADVSGACGCCGMRALVDAEGHLFALFRGARDKVHRETTLLSSIDRGTKFNLTVLQDWETGMCPMSSAALAVTGRGMVAAWETQGKIYMRPVKSKTSAATLDETMTTGSKAKHPSLATNIRGETLLVWTEGTGWMRGGDLVWQVFDATGKPTLDRGRRPGIPVWSYAASYARADGTFVIVY